MLEQKLHDTSVKLGVLYYEERVLDIHRPPEEVTALRNRIKAGMPVILEDGWKLARIDRNNPNK